MCTYVHTHTHKHRKKKQKNSDEGGRFDREEGGGTRESMEGGLLEMK